MTTAEPRFLDFFAGSGLVTLGVKDHCQTVWANDFCEKKRQIYEANHGTNHFCGGRIQEVHGASIPAAEIAWASFPCQDLSLAGSRGGLDAARSGLFWEWLRVLDGTTRRVPVLAIENVIGLLSTAGGQDYRNLHQALAERGYRVGPMVINAWHWLPQSRPRLFIVAVDAALDTAAFEDVAPNWLHNDALLRAVIGLEGTVLWKLKDPPKRRARLSNIIEWDAEASDDAATEGLLALVPPGHRKQLDALPRSVRAVFPGYRRTRNGRQVLELRFDGIAGCLRTAKGGSSRQFCLLYDAGRWRSRLLTIREAARLMGVPDSYRFSEVYNDSYNAIGDAVAVPVVHHLAQHLLAPLTNLTSKNESGREAERFCLKA